MSSVVAQLLSQTQKLYSHLKQGMPESDRENYIQKTQQLIEEREVFLSNLPRSYTKEEQELGRQIIALNNEIDRLLKNQAEIIKKELEQFKQKKERSHHYANPYQNVSIDGMFFDKKK